MHKFVIQNHAWALAHIFPGKIRRPTGALQILPPSPQALAGSWPRCDWSADRELDETSLPMPPPTVSHWQVASVWLSRGRHPRRALPSHVSSPRVPLAGDLGENEKENPRHKIPDTRIGINNILAARIKADTIVNFYIYIHNTVCVWVCVWDAVSSAD